MRPQFLNGNGLIGVMNALAQAVLPPTPTKADKGEELPEKLEPTQTPQSPFERAPK